MKQKIIFTINSIQKNGPNTVLENMVKGLKDDNFDIYIISFLSSDDKGELEKFNKYPISHICLSYENKKEIIQKGTHDLQEIVSRLNPNIIHSHGLFPDYVSSRLTTSAIRITTIHNLPFEDYVNRFGAIAGILMAKWHMSILKKFDQIICCSETSYKHLKKHTNKEVTFIRNAINIKEKWEVKKEKVRDLMRENLGISSSDIVYIFAGNLSKGKNIKFLVDNFTRNHLANEKLVILGLGKELEYCEQNNDGSILLLGFQKNVKDYYFMSDIYISASKSEGFSISILEALECGLYIFLSNIPAHLEVLNVDKRSFIGSSFSEGSFSKDLIKFRKKYLKLNNKDDVITFKNEHFTAKLMMEQYKKYYTEMH